MGKDALPKGTSSEENRFHTFPRLVHDSLFVKWEPTLLRIGGPNPSTDPPLLTLVLKYQDYYLGKDALQKGTSSGEKIAQHFSRLVPDNLYVAAPATALAPAPAPAPAPA